MLLVDTLVVIGLSTLSLDTIHEADGKQERTFWLRNNGPETVKIVQGYTSCGCVGLTAPLGEPIQPGDSVKALLSFDPKGKSGAFYERGILVYGASRKHIDLAMQGVCLSSEETLLRQFPVRINDDLRLSANHFDLGLMAPGETKTRHIVICHRDENDRQECIPVSVKADSTLTHGVHQIQRLVETRYKGKKRTIKINFNIKIK